MPSAMPMARAQRDRGGRHSGWPLVGQLGVHAPQGDAVRVRVAGIDPTG